MKLSLELNKKYPGPTNRAFEHVPLKSYLITLITLLMFKMLISEHAINASNCNKSFAGGRGGRSF